MKLMVGIVLAASLSGVSAAWADCAVNACQYGSGCYSDNAILCQDRQRMQCKTGSWTAMPAQEGACAPTFKMLVILEASISGETAAMPAAPGTDAVPARRFEGTIAEEIGALCNYRQSCSFVPRETRPGGGAATFSVVSLRYACRDWGNGTVEVFGPAPPNGGSEDAVYNLNCLAQ